MMLRTLAWLGCALAAGACTTLAPLPDAASAGDGCGQWFVQLDAAVDAAGVRDAQDERVPGFAFLRVDRLAVATRDSMPLPQWLERAAALDREARDAETANLPVAVFPIDGVADATAADARSQRCREAMTQRVLEDAAQHTAVLERARVPDRYATSLRVLGAYPLVRWPFFAGVQLWQQQHTLDMARWAEQPPPTQRFVPPAGDRDAPVFEIEMHDAALAPFDRFGVPMWTAGADAPSIDTTQPVVYRRDSHTLYAGRWLRQAVYTLWFPERPKSGRFDLLGGALDGVIVRITFAPDGKPLMLDTIHACGCYHLFFPAADVTLRDGAPTHEEWAFVAGALPPFRQREGRATGRHERLVVRIATRTHYVTGLARDAGVAGAGYALRPENELRALPLPGGGTRSLYASDGLVRGTERGERFLFWPMGIASAGAMRQWGHHATAFVGRRHFDDPNLLESRFTMPAWATP
jgi:hypothetical protein